MGGRNDLINGAKSTSDTITIVSGLPRSGTSMMMRMLEAGGVEVLSDGVREADRDNPNGYYEFEPVKGLHRGRHAWLQGAPGKAVKVVSPLLRFLPREYHYNIIFMQRKMEEVLASQRVMLANRGETVDRYGDQKMASVYDDDLHQIQLWMDNHPNVKTVFVSYNSLLRDPLPPLRQVSALIDGALDIDAMARMIDVDLYRQRG